MTTADTTSSRGIAHARGVLHWRFEGLQREQAHADLFVATNPFALANGRRGENLKTIADLFRGDPSLLVEPIPSRAPAQGSSRTSRNRAVGSDIEWKNRSKWYGTWLTYFLACHQDFEQPAQIVLEAGIHPDDGTIWPRIHPYDPEDGYYWPGGRLLDSLGWATKPERLSLALRYGADRDPGDIAWNAGYLAQNLRVIGRSTSKDYDKTSFMGAIECVNILLDAGISRVDPEPVLSSTASEGQAGPLPMPALHYLAQASERAYSDAEVSRQLFALADRLHLAGADLNRRANPFVTTPQHQRAPVVTALRNLNIDFACHLVRLGCKTDDHHIMGSGRVPDAMTLDQVALDIGGELFMARIAQAKMQRVIEGHASPLRVASPQVATERPTDKGLDHSGDPPRPTKRLRAVRAV